MNSKVGVVTVTYNSERVIDAFMKCMLSQSNVGFILFVIDNASSDKTLDVVSRYSEPRVVINANKNNLGVAEGNNQGIRLALQTNCDLILLINNDTEFVNTLLSSMTKAIAHHNADMLVPKIMFFEPRNMIWCAGGFFNRKLGAVTGHRGEGEIDEGQFDTARRIEYAPTCCMLIKADAFSRVGMMDPKYFVYYDDTDFCWRAMKANLALWYEPSSVLYHKVSSLTGGYESDFTIRYATRNKVYFTLKNLGIVSVIYGMSLYQIVFLQKLICRTDSLKTYIMKLKAYSEGIRLFFASNTDTHIT